MRSARTDKVLNLLSEKPSNPIVKIPEEEYIPPIYSRTGSGTQQINVMFLLMNEQLGTVMERFHCCMCANCAGAVTREAMKQLPPLIVTVKRKEDEQRVNELAARTRPRVIQIVTKAVITVKSNPPPHEINVEKKKN
ncbi:MAG: hypothetical protein NC084_08110 [Bacteroides sp.]|nr:hypothetical protein [Eubacterium sp.]MCM1418605.1 hypothetical protein [Roseburia sp.]MCM1462659.1 hypothetical protein [Bacteroides sp.]